MARPIWGSWSAPSQPLCAAGSLSIHARIAWITRMSPSRVITASPPGRSSPASEAISRSTLCIHSSLGVLDAHGPAYQGGGRATVAVAKDLVAIADRLTLEVQDPRRRSSRFAAQDVAVPVRHQREVSELDPPSLVRPGLEPQPARGDDVKPEVPRHRRQCEPPGRGQLGAAVVRAVHPQEVQRLAERVRRREGVGRFHDAEYAYLYPGRPVWWTIEHELALIGHRQSAYSSGHWSHGIHRTNTRKPGQRGADHVPPDIGEHGRRALGDRPRAARGPAGPGRPACSPEAGGALRGRRGHDALQDGTQAGRRGARRGGRRPAWPEARLRERRRR